MRWRWLIFDYVDPRLGLTREERRRVRHETLREVASEKSALKSMTPRARVLLPLALLPGLLSALPQIGIWLGVPRIHIFGTFLMIPVMWAVAAFIASITFRPQRILALRRLGYDVCFGCGYALCGLDDTVLVCPECGRTRDTLPLGPMPAPRADASDKPAAAAEPPSE